MTYDETVEYLFNCAPPFQQVGGAAYKEGLANTIAIDNHLGNPHRKFRTIHVAGTNGKGSSSHTLAAILQEAGYKVGLYTSPHLIDFRERIRVNGTPASKQFVIDFVERERAFFEPLSPSFFELTTAMAFTYFAQQEVDVAIIEVGLGGRLDCTNIISPDICIITNISLDHTQFLGNTEAKIAAEKAGIIKSGIPVIIGEATPETQKVFTEKAAKEGAPIIFAQDKKVLLAATPTQHGIRYTTADFGNFEGELGGEYQANNTNTILTALRELLKKDYRITTDNVHKGFANVCKLTGLMGRWQKIGDNPRIVCDAGHNIGGIKYVAQQLARQDCDTLRIVFGMVSDKDISAVLAMMPANATYYFTQASIKRAMPADELRLKAAEYNLHGNSYPTVGAALQAAQKEASHNDFIFVGGSCFVVADLLSFITPHKEE
ncbi:MAG: bifunctional folylpolyglutamate synthase/dihydrofolate synthase [Bacteroidaceae bacterium]|nr:bifunctional folylpolyglutamate synthase/dihydrofolate synthase [Bacteroidaceae bacterium]